MKKALVIVVCCRECPFSVEPKPRVKICSLQDDKRVIAHEIDVGCPLEDHKE